MAKFCINCKMGDPLPHDERIGQNIYNLLRPVEGEYDKDPKIFLRQVLEYKASIADKLFNLTDSDLQRMLFEKHWCKKCKAREF